MINKSKEILIFKNIEEITCFAVEKWTDISEKAIKDKDRFTVALSGGKTPVVLYQKLSDKKTLPWGKTDVFMVDERFVPYGNDENNYHMINRILLRHVKIPAKNIYPILTSHPSPRVSAERYEQDLISYFKTQYDKLPRFDLILLGIGEDGHTASLFPDIASSEEDGHLAVAVSSPDITKEERITLTFPVINNADNIMFLAAGANKAKTIKEVVEKEDSLLPAAMIRPQKGKLFFLLDESAGSLLSESIQ